MVSPKYLTAAHQTAARMEVPNKSNNNAIFTILDVTKSFVQIDGARYSNQAVSVNYAANDNFDHWKYLNFFKKEYVGEDLLNLSTNYTKNEKLLSYSSR